MLLVTGGLGFIGAHVARAALDSGESCVVTSHVTRLRPLFLDGGGERLRNTEGGEPAPRLVVEQLDMGDAERWREIGERHPITGVIHLAAAGIGATPLDAVRANLDGLCNAIASAAGWGVRVSLASTIGVYAGVAETPYREDAPLPTIGLHGVQASKKAGEIVADLAARHGGPDVVSMRLPAVWGPLGRPSSPFFALPALAHAAARKEPIKVPAGDSIELCYVKDCAAAILALQRAASLSHRVYNIGAGRATSNAEVAAAIHAIEPDAPIILDQKPQPVEAGWLDTGRLVADTDFQPRFGLDVGMRDYLGWLRAGNRR